MNIQLNILADGFRLSHAGDAFRWGSEPQQNLWDGIQPQQVAGISIPPYFFNLGPRVLEAMDTVLPLLVDADTDGRPDINHAGLNLA